MSLPEKGPMSSISTRQHLVPGLLDASEDDLAHEQRLDTTWLLVALVGLASAGLVFLATR